MREAGKTPFCLLSTSISVAVKRDCPVSSVPEARARRARLREVVSTYVFHCAGVVRGEHFELACYDPAIALARDLGHGECANLLRRNRDEDERALKDIAKLADKLRRDLPR